MSVTTTHHVYHPSYPVPRQAAAIRPPVAMMSRLSLLKNPKVGLPALMTFPLLGHTLRHTVKSHGVRQKLLSPAFSKKLHRWARSLARRAPSVADDAVIALLRKGEEAL